MASLACILGASDAIYVFPLPQGKSRGEWKYPGPKAMGYLAFGKIDKMDHLAHGHDWRLKEIDGRTSGVAFFRVYSTFISQ